MAKAGSSSSDRAAAHLQSEDAIEGIVGRLLMTLTLPGGWRWLMMGCVDSSSGKP